MKSPLSRSAETESSHTMVGHAQSASVMASIWLLVTFHPSDVEKLKSILRGTSSLMALSATIPVTLDL